MSLSMEEIGGIALGALSDREKNGSAVYLDERELNAGDPIQIDSHEIQAPWPAVRVFIDLEPRANWGHSARWLLINRETGQVDRHDVQYPPWLRGEAPNFRLIWKGAEVPDWALAA